MERSPPLVDTSRW